MFADQLVFSIYRILGFQAFNCIYAKHINESFQSPGHLTFLCDSPFSTESKLCQKEAATWPHSSPSHWKYTTDK